jgi:uncharacterized protein involved in outer membrane biogenesis
MRWKWILGIIVVVIIAFFVTVYAIVSTYDFNKLKPMMIQNAKSFTGRDLRVGGDIEIGISLLPTLVTGDVGFQNAPWGSRPEMAKIKRLEVQVALFPLISGDIEVKRLILVEPDILIETDSSGKSPGRKGAAKTQRKTGGRSTTAHNDCWASNNRERPIDL